MFKCNTCLYESQPYDGIACWNCYNNSKYVSTEREENMENKNYIVINGKKAELTEEQLRQLGIEVEKSNPYERAKRDGVYYHANGIGDLFQKIELTQLSDEYYYLNGNYCANEEMARQDMLHDLLNRKLRQFSNLNGGIELNSNINKDIWESVIIEKYYICYDYVNEEPHISTNSLAKTSNAIYFVSSKIAECAIEEIVKPFMGEYKEFVW